MRNLFLLTFGLLFALQVTAVAAPSAQGALSKVLKEENSTRDISPKGWTKGKKTGWGGNTVPPGRAS